MSAEDRGARSAAWGVAAGVAGTVAIAVWQVAVAGSTFPIWPTYVFGGLALSALYMCFATILKWWPCRPPIDESSAGVVDPPVGDDHLETAGAVRLSTSAGSAGSDGEAPVQHPIAPIPIQLKPEAEPGSASTADPTSAVTDRWCHTSDGFKVPALSNLQHTVMDHPGYRGQSQDRGPSIKIGVLVGCQEIDTTFSGSALRAKFVGFLNSPAMRELIRSLTHVASDATWTSVGVGGIHQSGHDRVAVIHQLGRGWSP